MRKRSSASTFKEEEHMKVTIVGRQMNVWDEMKATIEAKLAKLDKYFSDEGTATVTLSTRRTQKCLEVTIVYAGTIFRSEVQDETFRNALDRAVYTIERQIRKNKTRLAKRLRSGAFDQGIIETGEEFEEDAEFTVRRKSFTLKPMSVEEAIMQMNLLDHEFFVFKDDDTEKVCVVYKRHDKTYGLISADEE
ncbi:MAG: ribosome-associated translation inhibitor RaiA [Ruminococcaceae bacterium]|nr:ribosome-associated translation inhibitor RaiA [Oscillospiraceae bacterium]